MHASGAVLLACRTDGGDSDESEGASSGDLPASDSGPGSPDKCVPSMSHAFDAVPSLPCSTAV